MEREVRLSAAEDQGGGRDGEERKAEECIRGGVVES